MTAAPRISLVIPTQRRLDGLRTAARSTFRQTDVDPATLEPLYVHEIKWLEAPQLDKLERLWLKNEK